MTSFLLAMCLCMLSISLLSTLCFLYHLCMSDVGTPYFKEFLYVLDYRARIILRNFCDRETKREDKSVCGGKGTLEAFFQIVNIQGDSFYLHS